MFSRCNVSVKGFRVHESNEKGNRDGRRAREAAEARDTTLSRYRRDRRGQAAWQSRIFALALAAGTGGADGAATAGATSGMRGTTTPPTRATVLLDAGKALLRGIGKVDSGIRQIVRDVEVRKTRDDAASLSLRARGRATYGFCRGI